jgi:hypothetical protein
MQMRRVNEKRDDQIVKARMPEILQEKEVNTDLETSGGVGASAEGGTPGESTGSVGAGASLSIAGGGSASGLATLAAETNPLASILGQVLLVRDRDG